MPKLNLGRVVGRDGGFGNIDTVYINNGGAPSVTVEASGEDTAKDFVFTFKNLVRDVATADEVDQIAAGEIVQSSNVITAGVMSSIWAKIKAAFAPKSHTHDASDITAGQLAAALIANGLITSDMLAAGAVTTTKIADGAVTNAKLDQTLRDSLSRLPFATADMADDLNDHELGAVAFKFDTANIPNGLSYGICLCFRATPSWFWQFATSTEKSSIYVRRKVNAAAWTDWVQL